jgi:GAF domain-containing protein
LPGGGTATRRYATAGAAFGFIFPIVATVLAIWLNDLPLSLESALAVQRAEPLLWIIDTAPFFLGLFAAVAGRHADSLVATNRRLSEVTKELENAKVEAERTVAERTEQVRAGSDVARAAASILDPDRLLRDVVNLIADRFRLYYVAVFTLDAEGRYAVLREATGDVGQVLKQRGYRLEVGGQSMIGTAIAWRKPRIALDVGREPIRFANPLLPETRSEIALPLMAGGRVLGALDAQSAYAAAFDEAGTTVLQSMADQIAIALNNAEQFHRAERQAAAVAVLNQLSRDLTMAGSLEAIGHAAMAALASLVAVDRLLLGLATPDLKTVKLVPLDPTNTQGLSHLQSRERHESLPRADAPGPRSRSPAKPALSAKSPTPSKERGSGEVEGSPTPSKERGSGDPDPERSEPPPPPIDSARPPQEAGEARWEGEVEWESIPPALPTAQTLAGQCILTGQNVLIADLSALASITYQDAALARKAGIRSLIGVPLRVSDQTLGALFAGAARLDAYSPADVSRVEQVAAQLAVAVESLNRAEDMRRALEELDAANRRLTGEAWLGFTRRLSRRGVIRIGAYAGDQEPSPEVEEAVSTGQVVAHPSKDSGQALRSPRPEGAGERSAAGEILPLRFRGTSHGSGVRAGSYRVAVPIVLRGVPIGVFRLSVPEHSWSDELAATLDSIAGHVAQAVENARLVEEAEERAARERALADATERIRSKADVERILQTAAEELARHLSAARVAVRFTPPGDADQEQA